MCSFCKQFPGITLPHTEEDCAVKQSAICPVCGPGLHFAEDCPLDIVPFQKEYEEPLWNREPTAIASILLGHTNAGYLEYQKLYKLETHQKIEKNRAIVEAHLESRGFRLVNPIQQTIVPLEPEKTTCKLRHGGNICCQPKKPKKKVLRCK